MKRYICLVIMLLLLLSACVNVTDHEANTILFYYPRKTITYGKTDSVIASEIRDEYSDTDDFYKLLALYLKGPNSTELRSPFPAGLQLVQAKQDGQVVDIILNSALDTLSGLEKTLACACLSMTCFELTDAETVCISTEAGIAAGESPIIIEKSSLLLLDDGATAPTAAESANK